MNMESETPPFQKNFGDHPSRKNLSHQGKILVVDDNLDNLNLLEEILDLHGYEVSAFPHGIPALESAKTNPPDLILLDIMMPDYDGFQICKMIQSESNLTGIPVIFLSALGDMDSKIRAFSEGGVDYVTKPFQAEEILARVKTHLSLRILRKKLETQNQHLESIVQEKMREVLESQMATLAAISSLVEFRDEQTGRHIDRTRIYCSMLARELQTKEKYRNQISDGYIENLYYAAPLHDIGKVGIPDEILLKPGKHTPEEFSIMQSHVEIGTRALRKVLELYPKNDFIHMGIDITRSHHERWDGSGYPDGLKGDAIPLSARIMALADAYDALRSKRPYKTECTHAESRDCIVVDSGLHFDPDVVSAFLAKEKEFEDISNRLKPGSDC